MCMSLHSRKIHSKPGGMGDQRFPSKYICISFMQF